MRTHEPLRARRAWLAVASSGVILALLAACTDDQPAAHHAPPQAAPVASSRGVTTSPGVTKMLVFVVENHSFDQMRQGMPFVYGLAKRYGYASDYRALTHPSLPNYLAMAGGATFGVHDDRDPASHPLPGASAFGRAIRAGSTARLYAEAMGRRCRLTSTGTYAVRHNPWTYFAKERGMCRRHDVLLRRLGSDADAGRLPAVGMVIPDLCNDAHDCSLAGADAWLRKRIRRCMAGPDWTSGRLAVVITADEDDHHHGNRILTVVAQPDLQHVVVPTRLTHYSLARSYAEVAKARPLRNARTAPSLLQAFGLTTS